jgi:hypothetical protein
MSKNLPQHLKEAFSNITLKKNRQIHRVTLKMLRTVLVKLQVKIDNSIYPIHKSAKQTWHLLKQALQMVSYAYFLNLQM